jgi:hypothetical protein
MSRQRLVGLLVLRSYLLIAFTLTIVKIAETAWSGSTDTHTVRNELGWGG